MRAADEEAGGTHRVARNLQGPSVSAASLVPLEPRTMQKPGGERLLGMQLTRFALSVSKGGRRRDKDGEVPPWTRILPSHVLSSNKDVATNGRGCVNSIF